MARRIYNPEIAAFLMQMELSFIPSSYSVFFFSSIEYGIVNAKPTPKYTEGKKRAFCPDQRFL